MRSPSSPTSLSIGIHYVRVGTDVQYKIHRFIIHIRLNKSRDGRMMIYNIDSIL